MTLGTNFLTDYLFLCIIYCIRPVQRPASIWMKDYQLKQNQNVNDDVTSNTSLNYCSAAVSESVRGRVLELLIRISLNSERFLNLR